MKRSRIFDKNCSIYILFFAIFDSEGFNVIFYDILRFKFL